MTRNNADAGTRTVPCHYCDAQVEPINENAPESICPDCIIEQSNIL